MTALKKFVKHRLVDLGISQAEIARHLGIDPSAVSYLLSGKRELKARELIPLAQKLKVEPMELLKYL